MTPPSQFQTGIFLISLDFELYWGVRDKRSLDSYRENLQGTREAVLDLLRLFEERGVHATWSTVGFLFQDSQEALNRVIPEKLPGYQDQNLCPYQYIQQTSELFPEYHFAADLIQKIARTPGQEIGTHTYCHFYCLEDGVSRESFSADLSLARAAGEQCGLVPRSLVFPRNQWREDFLSLLPDHGLTCYRGVEQHPAYTATSNRNQGYLRRAARLLDTYINLTGHHTFGPVRCGPSPPYNLPASRFLRPYSPRLRLLDSLKERRIVQSMRYAAAQKQAFHLWWHPHNFGSCRPENLEFLKTVLDEYGRLASRQGMRSLNMVETADEVSRTQAIPRR